MLRDTWRIRDNRPSVPATRTVPKGFDGTSSQEFWQESTQIISQLRFYQCRTSIETYMALTLSPLAWSNRTLDIVRTRICSVRTESDRFRRHKRDMYEQQHHEVQLPIYRQYHNHRTYNVGPPWTLHDRVIDDQAWLSHERWEGTRKSYFVFLRKIGRRNWSLFVSRMRVGAMLLLFLDLDLDCQSLSLPCSNLPTTILPGSPLLLACAQKRDIDDPRVGNIYPQRWNVVRAFELTDFLYDRFVTTLKCWSCRVLIPNAC